MKKVTPDEITNRLALERIRTLFQSGAKIGEIIDAVNLLLDTDYTNPMLMILHFKFAFNLSIHEAMDVASWHRYNQGWYADEEFDALMRSHIDEVS